ncbi:MAG: phosphatidylserine/phosphatidylglycerophosphate/cardiolipin synthase family protein [Kofleriaceae bacterium]|nr:phosphatidylserine/phosphatidylglycerophosphate/cardiolipin synthase family protein [Kofleriaceae bacterium]MCB9571629.1 phosphatidylserine/phosphatidylglycerophosphate/cardiolipin synthase family protein [Kofleriaceae bacterium]
MQPEPPEVPPAATTDGDDARDDHHARSQPTPSRMFRVQAAPPVPLRRYVVGLQRLRPGNQVTLLRGGGETFPAMLAAIGAARRQVLLETYILEDDATGNRFADALRARARAGVDVRILYDGVGGMSLASAWIDGLRADGVKFVEYHPIAPWRRRFNLFNRDHRKILVVDDEVAFTGGLNVSDDYAAVADGGAGWHDMHCMLRGPIVLDLSRLFRRTWIRNDGPGYPAPPRPHTAGPAPADTADAADAADAWARMLENGERRRKRKIRRAYTHAIDAARTSVLLENAYFLPELPMRRAMYRAVKRGVDVRVIVPGNSDVKTVEYAGLYVYRRLARHGVRILRWKGVMLHAKTAVIDAVWSTVGSYNFDARSLFYNLEVVVELLDAGFGELMERQFEVDVAHTEPFDERAWLRLPWWKKALAYLAFQLRRWL